MRLSFTYIDNFHFSVPNTVCLVFDLMKEVLTFIWGMLQKSVYVIECYLVGLDIVWTKLRVSPRYSSVRYVEAGVGPGVGRGFELSWGPVFDLVMKNESKLKVLLHTYSVGPSFLVTPLSGANHIGINFIELWVIFLIFFSTYCIWMLNNEDDAIIFVELQELVFYGQVSCKLLLLGVFNSFRAFINSYVYKYNRVWRHFE